MSTFNPRDTLPKPVDYTGAGEPIYADPLDSLEDDRYVELMRQFFEEARTFKAANGQWVSVEALELSEALGEFMRDRLS